MLTLGGMINVQLVSSLTGLDLTKEENMFLGNSVVQLVEQSLPTPAARIQASDNFYTENMFSFVHVLKQLNTYQSNWRPAQQ